MITMLILFRLITLVPGTMAASGQSDEDGPPSERRSTIRARSDALFEDYLAENRAYYEATRRATTNEEAASYTPPDGTAYAGRFMMFARDARDDLVAAEALSRVLLVDLSGPFWKEAIERIRSDHIESPAIGPALRLMAMDTTPPEVEPILRAALSRNPHVEVRAQAALGLAQHLQRLAGEAENMRRHPDRFERAAGEFGRESTARLRDRDPEALRREAETLLELVIDDYAGVASLLEGPPPAEVAAAQLREIRELVVGHLAPEIQGEDIDGATMRLSDYRGKVVVLVWWATWCGPCMAMVPHDRELVRRLEGEPFVLLGVNGDEDRGRLRHQIEAHEINWRSWYDGGPEGPISTRWNIRGWPTVYVLDAGGVIRYKGHRDEKELDQVIEHLLDVQESGSGPASRRGPASERLPGPP